MTSRDKLWPSAVTRPASGRPAQIQAGIRIRVAFPVPAGADPGSGLDFLEEVASFGEKEPEGRLGDRCREERRMTGAAVLDDLFSG